MRRASSGSPSAAAAAWRRTVTERSAGNAALLVQRLRQRGFIAISNGRLQQVSIIMNSLAAKIRADVQLLA
jgi:hypothetical protein